MFVNIKMLDPEAIVPTYAYEGDAGVDLRSSEDAVIEPGERVLVPTGLAIAIPDGYAGFVQPRSGLAINHGISLVNSPGLIDSKYRGEIKVIMINLDKEKAFNVKKNDKIAQLVIQKIENVVFKVTKELDETVRGVGGFGSSGTT